MTIIPFPQRHESDIPHILMSSEYTKCPHIPWPALNAPYLDALGSIDGDIYGAAGEIWPWAAAYSISILGDEASGQLSLMKVCARITEKRAAGSIEIESVLPYLKTAFKREVWAQLKKNRSVDLESTSECASWFETDIDRKILVEQMLSRMDPANRRITELLILGYSFEEIARKAGMQSNVIRSRHSKQLMKLKRDLRERKPS